MHDFRRLEVWIRARELAVVVYRLSETLPRSEQFGLTNQMRRAAVSVASNIAEGAARGSDRDFARFLRYSTGSAAELQTQLLIASDIGYVDGVRAAETAADARNVATRIDHLRRALQP